MTIWKFPNNYYVINKATICNVYIKGENISDHVKKGASTSNYNAGVSTNYVDNNVASTSNYTTSIPSHNFYRNYQTSKLKKKKNRILI